MDKEEIDKIKNAVMQIYEGNESKGLDILCLLVGWIPNSKSSHKYSVQPVEADANGKAFCFGCIHSCAYYNEDSECEL